MTIFDKLLNRRKKEEADQKPVIPEVALESVPEKEEESVLSRFTASAKALLEELYGCEEEDSREPEFLRNLLDEAEEKFRRLEQAEEAYKQWEADRSAAREEKDGAEESDVQPLPPSADACVEVVLAPDQMAAFCYLLPPVGGGTDIMENDIMAALQKAGVTAGIDEELVQRVYQQKIFCRLFAAARGKTPVHGENGTITDRFSRIREIHLQEDSHGNIDHKNLNMYQNIKAGEVICDITPPGSGTDGFNVLGTILPARKGIPAVIPQGKNTVIKEDGTALLSKIDGDLSYINNVFRVEAQLVIPRNVDNSVGNLDFEGDILVKGDICRGFTVNAGGNVTVLGMVESAMVSAGEDIIIEKGMNGGGSGFLKAGRNISSRFLEHANVTADGNVTSETVINSHITSGGTVQVLSGRGIIIGGSISAAQSVEARKIGTLSNNETVIKIGCSVRKEENAEEVATEHRQAVKTLDMINKNYRYLLEMPSLPESKKEIFHTLSEQKKLYEDKVKELSLKLEELRNIRPDYSKCRVKSDIIYGVTEISLGYSRLIIKDTAQRCNIYVKDDELVLGTF